MRSRVLVVVLLAFACGKDGGGGSGDGDGDVIDARTADAPAADATVDAPAGTQGPGQFCDTLPEGGPDCMANLECCADKVCRLVGDCGGGGGFIPCECTDDCPGNSFICCDTPSQVFCTKRNVCSSFGGSELVICP